MPKRNASQPDEKRTYSIREEKTSVKGREYLRYIVGFGNDKNGRRVRRTFATKAKAAAAIREQMAKDKSRAERDAILKRMIGEKAERLSADNLLDAVSGLEILSGAASLTKAARYYMTHNRPPSGKRTVSAVIAEYLKEAENDALRPASIML